MWSGTRATVSDDSGGFRKPRGSISMSKKGALRIKIELAFQNALHLGGSFEGNLIKIRLVRAKSRKRQIRRLRGGGTEIAK